jgi:PAS domain S-box-containing protein
VVVGATILSESDNSILGMVGGTIQWDVIDSLINGIRDHILNNFGGLIKICLIEHNGIYVYHWDPDKAIHLKLDNNGKPILNEIGEKVAVRMKITEEPSKELAQIGKDMIQGREGFGFFTDPDLGQKMVIIFAPVQSANYSLAMVVPKSQILSSIKYLRWFFVAIALVSILLVMVIYLSVAKRITRPIEALSMAAKNLAKGNWQTLVSSDGIDEVRDLAMAFNEMTSSLKIREAALKESEARFRAIFESTSDCIFVWDKKYNCLFANHAAKRHLLTAHENISGKNIQDVLSHIPDLVNSWTQRIDKVFEKGEGFRAEDTVFMNEKTIYNESVFSPIRNAERNVIAVGIAFRDITERKEAAEKIIQHNKEVSEANKRFEMLVANTTEREKRMLELKQEVNDLLVSAGKETKYSAPKKVDELLN